MDMFSSARFTPDLVTNVGQYGGSKLLKFLWSLFPIFGALSLERASTS